MPKRIRTSDLQIRNLMLYPAELWAQKRSRGDSNPRYPLGVQRLSRAPHSTTLAPLQNFLPEKVGFEPTGPFGPTVFKTAAIDHSATSPLRPSFDLIGLSLNCQYSIYR